MMLSSFTMLRVHISGTAAFVLTVELLTWATLITHPRVTCLVGSGPSSYYSIVRDSFHAARLPAALSGPLFAVDLVMDLDASASLALAPSTEH